MRITTEKSFLPGLHLLLAGLLIYLTVTTQGFATSSTRPLIRQGQPGGLSPLFEENQGQTLPEVKYLARGGKLCSVADTF